MWKYLRELDPKSISPPPSKLKDGDKEITDPVDIANGFNGFFTNIVKEYWQPLMKVHHLPHTKNVRLLWIPIYPLKFNLIFPNTAMLFTKGVTQFRPIKSCRNRWCIIKDTKSGCSINRISCYKNYQS